jgi:hypothetical protein
MVLFYVSRAEHILILCGLEIKVGNGCPAVYHRAWPSESGSSANGSSMSATE